MSTHFYVYHHPDVTGKSFEQAVQEKIFIGVRSAGPEHTVHFTWSINPFKYIAEYYGEFWWIIDEYGRAYNAYIFALELAKSTKVVYDGDFDE